MNIFVTHDCQYIIKCDIISYIYEFKKFFRHIEKLTLNCVHLINCDEMKRVYICSMPCIIHFMNMHYRDLLLFIKHFRFKHTIPSMAEKHYLVT